MSLTMMSTASSSSSASGVQAISRPQQYALINTNEGKNVLRKRPPTGEVVTVRNGMYYDHHHPSTASTTSTISPFLSPASSFGQPQQQLQRETLPPLILDPSVASRHSHSVASNDPHPNSFTIFHKLFQVASGKRRLQQQQQQDHQHDQHDQHVHVMVDSPYIPEETAGHFARMAPRAGFLQKLGTSIPELKRRFFVLQPGTHLYYFLSPNDTEPRGCFDLDGSRVEEVDHLPDGRYRFALVWDHDDNNNHHLGEHRIVLEARTKDVGQEWMKRLQTERMSHVRAELQEMERQNDVQRYRISDLEQKVKDYQLVEQDRDTALEDAARWKEKFEQLDDALRLLTQQMCRPPNSDQNDNGETINTTETTTKGNEDVDTISNHDQNRQRKPDINDECPEDSQSALNTSRRDTSLLDSVGEDETNAMEIQIPGSHFAMLSNACQLLKDNLRLATLEATTKAQDLNTANDTIVALEKRLGRAEKHLCKLWEENCSIRTTLKQKKQEKKILVREYKSLALAHQALQSSKARTITNGQVKSLRESQLPSNIEDVSQDDGSVMTASEEDRLMNEIEESVISSIRIHEQLLGAGRALCHEFEDSLVPLTTNSSQPRGHSSSDHTQTARQGNEVRSTKPSTNPLQSKLSSLFDDDESDNSDDQSAAPSLISSVEAEYGEIDQRSDKDLPFPSEQNTAQSEQAPRQQATPERPNPLLQLDYDVDEEDEESSKPHLCATSSQSESSKSMITDNGKATSRLACPLADVAPAQHKNGSQDVTIQDGQVYHLTFHARKIGIQFQKVPPPKRSPTGLLTEAMRVELGADPADGQKTAAELRREGTYSALNDEETCNVATPVDAVLVCGLAGFDDAANCIRPQLGARLVAFDGVSVEVGKWTFDSIRKAIQARGRPLTLSFRNDFLTTEQRSILTRAIADEGNPSVPNHASINVVVNKRPSSTDPSVRSALSHESDYFVNQNDAGPPRTSSFMNSLNDDMSSSAASEHSYPASSRASSSFSASKRHFTPNFRSFSEAGSSSVISSAFAPLMANLMAGAALANKKQPTLSFTPEYMRREAGSLDETPQHQDFKANLL